MRSIRLRKREERHTEPLDESHEDITEGTGPHHDAEAVHHALGRLPPLQREVLTLHYLRDLTVEEMAAALDCPEGTVKSRLHHARIAMRHHLERNPHG